MKKWLPLELDPATSNTVLARKIRVRQALELVSQLPLTVGGNLSLSVLTLVAFQGKVSTVYAFCWIALFLVTAIPGLRQWIKYRKAPEPERVSTALIWRAALYSFIVALPWAIGNWLVFELGNHEDEQFMIFVTGGLTAGVITTLATIPMVSLVYVAVIVTPLILRTLMTGDGPHVEHYVMAGMLIIYVSLLSLFVRSSYRSLKAGVELEIDRQNMVVKLQEAHRRLSQTLNRSSDEILLFDNDECLVMSNASKSGSLLFHLNNLREGVTLEELAGNAVSSSLLQGSEDVDDAWLKKFLAWYRDPEGEFIVVTKGSRTCSLTVQPTSDGEVFLIIRDITDLSASAAMARQSTQRLQDFTETAADWMWEIDERAHFTLLTPQREASLPAESLLRHKLSDISTLMPNKAERKNLAAMIVQRRAFRDVRFQLLIDGGSLTLSISGKPIFNDDGYYLGHRGTFRDVTAEVLAVDALRDAKERAEYASRTKSEFLAHMSHELRTPLNAILGFSEIMTMEIYGKIEPPKYLEYVKTIHESGAHLLAIINDILDISRIEAGKAELNEQEIEVTALIESCMRLVEGRANDMGHIITIAMAPGLPKLWADERNVKQILINLLGNAVKFTPSGGRITLGAELTEQGCFRFFISDNGHGLSNDDQARVLTPFDRGSAMTRKETEGSGLGLPLCRLLTELHGGQLRIASELGKGTTVSIEFPRERTIDQKLSALA